MHCVAGDGIGILAGAVLSSVFGLGGLSEVGVEYTFWASPSAGRSSKRYSCETWLADHYLSAVKSDGDAGGAMSIRGSGRVVASLSGPAEDVADNGPARRQRFLDLTQHPIFVKPVDRAVALGIEEPGI